MKNIFLVFLCLSLFGCSFLGLSEEKSEPRFTLDYPKELQDVHSLIVQQKTADARLKVEDYLNKAENIHWYGHAYFLKGFLYEMDETYPEAIKFYKSAIEHGSQYESKVEAKALYNLSFVYEKLDYRKELLTALVDLMKRREFFDVLTGQVEIPARLAAAYASQRKLKEGTIFHREASRNYNDMIRNQKFRADKEEISKSLYYLGFAVFDENNEKYDDLIRKMSIGQKYFLASAEASKSSWSKRSADRMEQLFDRAWGKVLSFAPKDYDHDPLAFKKQKHRRQLVMAADLYDLIHRLQAEEFPMGDVNPRSKSIIDLSKRWGKKIESFALTLNVGPETIRTHKIKNKRLARYVEEKAVKVKVNKEQNKKAEKKEKTTQSEKPLPKKPDIGKDPNL